MTPDLFADQSAPHRQPQWIGESALLLPAFVSAEEVPSLLDLLRGVLRQAPARHFLVPGGGRMSVRSSNCGCLGWVSDLRGYRYTDRDPLSGRPWPALAEPLMTLAQAAAARAGFSTFVPDSCLINLYAPGDRMGLHRDQDEQDFSQPIVSLSLGLPAVFLWGGLRRRDPVRRIGLLHGDVLVWGGASRRVYHGVAPLAAGAHPLLGERRLNLTFRRAR